MGIIKWQKPYLILFFFSFASENTVKQIVDAIIALPQRRMELLSHFLNLLRHLLFDAVLLVLLRLLLLICISVIDRIGLSSPSYYFSLGRADNL